VAAAARYAVTPVLMPQLPLRAVSCECAPAERSSAPAQPQSASMHAERATRPQRCGSAALYLHACTCAAPRLACTAHCLKHKHLWGYCALHGSATTSTRVWCMEQLAGKWATHICGRPA
jgi:hypothetical protein